MISEVRKQTITYIVSAFGIVAGLAWNDAVKALIERFFPIESGNSLLAKFFYALVITLVVVVVTMQLLKWADKHQDKQ